MSAKRIFISDIHLGDDPRYNDPVPDRRARFIPSIRSNPYITTCPTMTSRSKSRGTSPMRGIWKNSATGYANSTATRSSCSGTPMPPKSIKIPCSSKTACMSIPAIGVERKPIASSLNRVTTESRRRHCYR